MTGPTEKPSNGEFPGNAFSGPTGAQHGSSNTQINHYAAPSTSPGGAKQVAALITVALFTAGAIGVAAIKFAPAINGNVQAEQASNPKSSQDSKPMAPPKSQQSMSPTPSPPSPPPPLEPKPGNITLEGENLCLDVRGEEYKSGTALVVQTYDCIHDEGQQWYWEGSYLRAYSGCLDPKKEGKEIETEVILWDCTGRKAQEWEWNDQGKLLNPNSGLCLGYSKELLGKGIPLRLHDCTSESARTWKHWGD